MKIIPTTRVLLVFAVVTAAVSRTHAAVDRRRGNSRDSSPAGAATPLAPGSSFETFQLILDRNIFDPNRTPRRGGSEEKAPRIDQISLVGTMQSDRGPVAFFDSPDSAFRKTAATGETIGDFKIKSITQDGVDLVREDKTTTVKVAQQLKRAEGGDWNVVSIIPPLPPRADGKAEIGPVLPPEAAPVEVPAEASEALKRLLEKRQKQLSK